MEVQKRFLQCLCYWYNLFREIFILCDNCYTYLAKVYQNVVFFGLLFFHRQVASFIQFQKISVSTKSPRQQHNTNNTFLKKQSHILSAVNFSELILCDFSSFFLNKYFSENLKTSLEAYILQIFTHINVRKKVIEYMEPIYTMIIQIL